MHLTEAKGPLNETPIKGSPTQAPSRAVNTSLGEVGHSAQEGLLLQFHE